MNITEEVISECIPVGCVRFQYIIQIHKNKLILQLIISSDMKTSMHSSRMRTARWLLYGGRGPLSRVSSVLGGICPGSLCLGGGGVLSQGVSVLGGLCPGGLCRGGLCRGVSVWGDLSGGSLSGGSP